MAVKTIKIKKKAQETFDEIIRKVRLEYALGNYKGFTSAKELMAELNS